MSLWKFLISSVLVRIERLKGQLALKYSGDDPAPLTLYARTTEGFDVVITCYIRQYEQRFSSFWYPDRLLRSFIVKSEIAEDVPEYVKEAFSHIGVFPHLVFPWIDLKRQKKIAINNYLDIVGQTLMADRREI